MKYETHSQSSTAFNMKTTDTSTSSRLLLMIGLCLLMTACSGSGTSGGTAPDSASTPDEEIGTPSTLGKVRAVVAFEDFSLYGDEYLIEHEDLMSGVISTGSTNTIRLFPDTEGPVFLQQHSDFQFPLIGADSPLKGRLYQQVGNTLFSVGPDMQYYIMESDALYNMGSSSSSGQNRPRLIRNIDNEFLLSTDLPYLTADRTRTLRIHPADRQMSRGEYSYRLYNDSDGWAVRTPSALMLRENKLFVSYHSQIYLPPYQAPAPEKASIAVFDWPLATGDIAVPMKIIDDSRTSPIGVHGSASAMFDAGNGDIYAWSMGAISGGFDPASTKPSGILRILSGTDDFDIDYFFDIQEFTSGGKLFWLDSLGNGKALGRIVFDEPDDFLFSAYSKERINQKLVMVDLEKQTLKDVSGVPMHQKSYTSPLVVHQGFAYVSIEAFNNAYVYRINIDSGEATRGAEIDGETVMGFYFHQK